MTVNTDVRDTAYAYLIWVILAPILGVACFQLDGVFIGATQTADMRNMMILSLAIYLISWAILSPYYGNHGLWASLMIFFVVRAITLAWRFSNLERQKFAFIQQ